MPAEQRRALIAGITGQKGRFLAELLLLVGLKWQDYGTVDQRFMGPGEGKVLRGDTRPRPAGLWDSGRRYPSSSWCR